MKWAAIWNLYVAECGFRRLKIDPSQKSRLSRVASRLPVWFSTCCRHHETATGMRDYVDEIMRCMQGPDDEAQIVRLCSL
jgi:hypothetical protein